ncbi:hypothetical protein BDV28DRAFT_154634 [Aspergillus coremiiformis]|uniref:Protein kinase domain-containing protein n=1 Tax=Aspergillus coremiiformis TaxID=138285 RepID=A0A5N6ZFJ9_9EURO|nr:hypothetical protein BDV28DRAFT_154634 [Aspergillus coremiiformis]
MVHLSNQPIRDLGDFKKFQCNDAWKLGRRMRDDMPGLHSIMVLRLQVNGIANLVAKTFFGKEYFELNNQLDPFLDESRAYEHILRNCPPSKLSYFPTYFGVILNLTRDKYPKSYALRPRAIVLERVGPDTCSWRILGTLPSRKYDLFDDFVAKICELPLSCFEKEWYISLSIDRLQRLAAMHDIGIIHRDICDEHFRLPHDFYDTVLYDFSHSYIINSPWPYVKRPKPWAELIRVEQNEVMGVVLGRAKRSEFRTHIATTLNMNLTTVMNFCSQELEDAKNTLEMISLKTRHRPDTFTHPSLASIFPFLESIRPKNSPAWHITRARLLPDYDSAWFLHTPTTGKQIELISLSGVERFELDVDTMAQEKSSYVLVLIPRSWNLEDHKQRLFSCAGLVANKGWGPIILKEEFEQLDS